MANETQPDQNIHQPPQDHGGTPARQLPKSTGVAFFDTQEAALDKLATIDTYAKKVDLFHIAIKEECKTINPELEKVGLVYSGAIWWQVHDRRVKDGWYNKEHTYGTTQPQKI